MVQFWRNPDTLKDRAPVQPIQKDTGFRLEQFDNFVTSEEDQKVLFSDKETIFVDQEKSFDYVFSSMVHKKIHQRRQNWSKSRFGSLKSITFCFY
jgi:hypothetical protein